MKRRRIDTRTISPRRPDVTPTESLDVNEFTFSLKKFCNEYLRAAMKLTVRGERFGVLNVSLFDTAYMLRLMVEFGGEDTVLETTLTLGDIFTVDTRFPSGLPNVSDISKIKAAGNIAGFHFELRTDRIIFRTKVERTGRLPVYSTDPERIFNALYETFFI